MAESRIVLPIGLEIINDQEEHTLYITDDVTGQNLDIEIKNTATVDTRLKKLPGMASANNYHFELVFRPNSIVNAPGTIALRDENFQLFTKIDDNGFIQSNPDGTLSLYFLANSALLMQPGEKIVIKLKGIRAAATGGTRSTSVLLQYQNLLHSGSKTFSGQKETHLNLINHRGRKNIPLHVGFVGNNKVLNDGVATNELTLRLTNTSRENEVITASHLSKMFLTFDFGQETQEWTLTTEELGNGIDINLTMRTPNGPLAWEATKTVGIDEWWFPFSDLHPGYDCDIKITNIVTGHPSGLTKMILSYENLPNYWDGQFNTAIEKSPLVTKGIKVGIGIASPAKTLDVNGDVNITSNLRTGGTVTFNSPANGKGLQIVSSTAGNSHFPWTNNWNYISGNGVIFRDAAMNERIRFDHTKGNITTNNGTIKADAFVGSGAVSRGMILMWSGTPSSIPNTWALCNGQNGTPDLRDRFIVGAGGSYRRNATGGANTVTLNTNQIPAHKHSASASSNGNHQHWMEGINASGLSKRKRRISGQTTVDMGFGGGRDADPNDTRWRGAVNTDYSGSHSHSISVNNTGGSQAHENRPPYLALAFIMKL